jgi:chromosome segregation ATPase
MYSVSKLAEMFNTTKATIYSKLEDETLKDEIINTKKGKQLTVNGLSKLQLIMSDSRVAYKNKNVETAKTEYNYQNEYINNLKDQLETLKEDKQKLLEDKNKLFDELSERNDQIKVQQTQIKELINSNKLLVERNPREEKEKEKEKKSWWPFNKK